MVKAEIEWQSPEAVPDVPAGNSRRFIVAVQRLPERPPVVFEASYDNDFEFECYMDCPPRSDERCKYDDDREGCFNTGWVVYEDGECGPLLRTVGQKLLGWAEYPKWQEQLND